MWSKDFRRSIKDFILSEGKTPEVEALVQNVDAILNRLSPRSKKDQRNIEVARHNLNQIKKKYKRELSELQDLKEQVQELNERLELNESDE